MNEVFQDSPMNEVLPCPFCGRQPDINDGDTLYPTGTGWEESDGLRFYRKMSEVPKEQWCYGMHCTESSGGCGAEIRGDNEFEALEKWNRRK